MNAPADVPHEPPPPPHCWTPLDMASSVEKYKYGRTIEPLREGGVCVAAAQSNTESNGSCSNVQFLISSFVWPMTIEYKGRVDTLIKKKIKCFPHILYKEIQMGSGEKSNMTIY